MKQFCRACLHKLHENNENIIKHKLVFIELTSLQIEDDDSLPKAVCDTCISQLLQFKSFKETCIKSDAYLRRPKDDNSEALFHLEEIKVENISASSEYDEIDAASPTQSIEIEIDDKNIRRSARTQKRKLTKNLDQNIKKIKQTTKTRSNEKDHTELKTENNLEIEDTIIAPPPAKKKSKSKTSNNSNTQPYQCHKCNRSYKTLEVLEIHLTVHETGMLKCDVCGKCFNRNHALLRHRTSHQSKTPCKVCNKMLNARSFSHHMLLHENNRTFVCDTCGLTFVTLGAVNAHKLKHIINEQPCSICGKVFRNKHNLSVHINQVHERKHSKNKECNICGKMLRNNTLLTHCRLIHTVYTTTENIFACKHCDIKCKSQMALEKHIKTVHIGERKYACTLCPKTYAHATLLKRHGYFHSGERPVHCEVCSKGFYLKAALDTHMNIHKRQWIAQGLQGITLHAYPRNKKKMVTEYDSNNE